MENKIEITIGKTGAIGIRHYRTKVYNENHDIIFECYGSTPEEAQQNARIAASGYLVEELVECINGLVRSNPIHEGFHEKRLKAIELLTKAKTL